MAFANDKFDRLTRNTAPIFLRVLQLRMMGWVDGIVKSGGVASEQMRDFEG